jgi:hypothetical protein
MERKKPWGAILGPLFYTILVTDLFLLLAASYRKWSWSLWILCVCFVWMYLFWWNLIFRIFRKSVEKIQVSLKSDNSNWYFTWCFHIYDNISLNSSYNEKCFRQSFRESQNTRFMFNNFFPPKVVPFMRLCRKIWWTLRGHIWSHNKAHTRCILDQQGYMHAHAHAPGHTHAHTCTYIIFIAFLR